MWPPRPRTYDRRVIIRLASVDDAEALTDLLVDIWDEAYSALVLPEVLATRRASRAARIVRWRDILTTDASGQWLAHGGVDGIRLVGFASVGPGRDAPEPALPRLEVIALYVRAEVYGSGFGYALLKAAIGDASAYLWVLDGNSRAIRFLGQSRVPSRWNDQG